MANGPLKIDARRQEILAILAREGKVSVSRLSERFDTTPVTIRSDLSALELAGRLERVQGGAIPKAGARADQPVAQAAEKQAIGEKTAALIREGDTLFINSGTTTRAVAAALKGHRNLNIVTNSVAVASELTGVNDFRVILLGGEMNVRYAFTCGGDAQEQLMKYQADYAILSVDGVSGENGITTYHGEEAIIDRLMMERAQKTVIPAVNTKIGRTGFSHIAALDQVYAVVTEEGCDAAGMEEIQAAGVKVILA